jgi:hypothetical protein
MTFTYTEEAREKLVNSRLAYGGHLLSMLRLTDV